MNENLKSIWTGRNDGEDPLHQRLFQKIQIETDYNAIKTKDLVFHGFAVDEGVKRNKGRVGAKDAPPIIRKNMANFPIVSPDLRLKDFGDLYCIDGNLEEAQKNLAENVSKVLSRGAKSIVLGGGHEVTFGHYSAIRQAFPNSKIGIINIDAHFDNRTPEVEGPSSGTGFWQIAQEGTIHSLHIGIQRNSNTLKLFDCAHDYGMKYILADELFFDNLPSIYERIDELATEADVLYLTICTDVFNASIAPGVSALAYNGIFADPTFMHFYRHILKQDKLIALDVAEVNPTYDLQERTARLAACLINEYLMLD